MQRLLKLTGSATTQLVAAVLGLLLNLSHHENLMWLMLEERVLVVANSLRDHQSARVRRLAALLSGSLLASIVRDHLEMDEEKQTAVLKCCGFLGHWAVEDRLTNARFGEMMSKGLTAVANKTLKSKQLDLKQLLFDAFENGRLT